MLKKHWNTSQQKAKSQELRAKSLFPWLFALSSLLLALSFLTSCAPKYAARPYREGVTLSGILAKLNTVQSIEAVLDLNYEKNEASMSGDAFLSVSPSTLVLRIYYLGFLAGEVKEDNGVIKSKPRLDKYKSVVLVEGLKNSFMWWTIRDYTVREEKNTYVLKNYDRELIIDKKDLLPLRQTIELDNGDELNISYDTPANSLPQTDNYSSDPDIAWYQSHMSITYRNQKVRVNVKSYTSSTGKEQL